MALRFRFLDEQDIADYGGDWWVWDEDEIARIRGRDLIALEEQIGMSLRRVRRGLREDSTLATMAAMWIALHRTGHPVAWDQFNPAVQLAMWEVVPEVPLASGEDPVSDSDSSTTPPPNPESVTS